MRARFLALLLLLPGCTTYSLQELRQINPTGSEFQQALAKEYLAYSEQLEQSYSWNASWHFADKGLTAAYGNDVGPENPADWGVMAEERAEMESARDALITALPPAVVSAKPAEAARAYRLYDCWVQRAGDGWAANRAAECKEGFEEALAGLQRSGDAVADEKGVDTTSYIVFFEWNRAQLSASGRKVVADVAGDLAGQEGYEVVLNGHTDTTGLERFNLKLSKMRAETVARALAQQGVAEERIKIFAFGESDPRVPTADGVDEPRNRRVEIFIQ